MASPWHPEIALAAATLALADPAAAEATRSSRFPKMHGSTAASRGLI